MSLQVGRHCSAVDGCDFQKMAFVRPRFLVGIPGGLFADWRQLRVIQEAEGLISARSHWDAAARKPIPQVMQVFRLSDSHQIFNSRMQGAGSIASQRFQMKRMWGFLLEFWDSHRILE